MPIRIALALLAALALPAYADEDVPLYFVGDARSERDDVQQLYVLKVLGRPPVALPVLIPRGDHVVLSPDRRYVALTTERGPAIYATATGKLAKVPITIAADAKHAAPRAHAVAWSPDGTRALFRVEADAKDVEEGNPPDTLGYLIARAADQQVEAVSKQLDAIGWTKDGAGLYVWAAPTQPTIRVYELASGKLAARAIASPCGGENAQIDFHGDELVCVKADLKAHTSEVLRQRLDSSAPTRLGPVARYADQQWPRYSPNGKKIAWEGASETIHGKAYKQAITIADLATGRVEDLTVCVGRCSFVWRDDSHLLVDSTDGIWLVEIPAGGTGRHLVHTSRRAAVPTGR